MQQTSKYQFKLIEGTDDFLPGPLNENMEKVEEVIAAAVADLGSGGKNARIIWGSYVGDGQFGADHPCVITLDFRPLLAVVADPSQPTWGRAIFLRGCPQQNAISPSFYVTVNWSDNSVSWYGTNNAAVQGSTSGNTYYYVVIGDSTN